MISYDEDTITREIHRHWDKYFSEDDNFTLWSEVHSDSVSIQPQAIWYKEGQGSGSYSCMYEEFVYKLADPKLFEKIEDKIKEWAASRCEILHELMV